MLTSPLLFAALTAALSVEAAPLAGEPVKGEWKSLNTQRVVIGTADGDRVLLLTTLRSVKVSDPAAAEPLDSLIAVQLRDESLLR